MQSLRKAESKLVRMLVYLPTDSKASSPFAILRLLRKEYCCPTCTGAACDALEKDSRSQSV